MGFTQDVFGSAPKSVLNKPFLQVQQRLAVGTSPAAPSTNEQQVALNNVVINEIPGAAAGPLPSVILPAGTYYIEASGYTSERIRAMKIVLKDSSGTILIEGAKQGSSFSPIPTLSGQVTFTVATTVSLWQKAGVVDTGTQVANAFGVSDVFGEIRAWRLDIDIECPVISDPTMVLARPLMHAVYETNENISLAVGIRTAILNSIRVNEIAGASLAANEITLPAGTYYVSGCALTRGSATNPAHVMIKNSSEIILLSGQTWGASSTAPSVLGRIVLTGSTTIKLVVEQKNASGDYEASLLSQKSTINELLIWQLDSVIKTPVLVNDRLFPLPGNVMVTGNMHGLEYSYLGVHSITVEAGICMDSTNETVLTNVNQQVVSIPSAANTVYNLFLCDDGIVRTDTDVNGANLVGYKIRWIGFVRNNSSAVICGFTMQGNHVKMWKSTDNIASTIISSSSWTAINHSELMPVSRIESLQYGATDTLNADVWASDDGVNSSFYVARTASNQTDSVSANAWGDGGNVNQIIVPYNENRTFKANANSPQILVSGYKLKR